ncbi:MAG: hypothetical protein WCH62_07985, partial [Candidatus Omnitrophota bacterium]
HEKVRPQHLTISHMFPSESVFRLKSFIDMCASHHDTDDGQPSDYEEVWVNGALKARGGFRFGRPFGCWRFFYESGKCSESVSFDLNGNIYGEHALFSATGTQLFSFCYQGPTLTGTFKEWYSNGQIKTEVEKFDDNKYGVSRSWYENGRIASESVYILGEFTGHISHWNSDGVLVYERIPAGNTRFYQEKEYNNKGQPMRMRSYLDHKLHGEEIEYYDFERQVMFDKPQGAYYVLGNKVTQDDFFAWKGEA